MVDYLVDDYIKATPKHRMMVPSMICNFKKINFIIYLALPIILSY